MAEHQKEEKLNCKEITKKEFAKCLWDGDTMKAKLTSAEAEVLVGELIGKHVKIINSSDPKLVGTEGEIIDETMKLLTIKTSEKEIKVQKEHNVFDFDGITIDGKKLKFRPHERIKKYWRKINGMH